MSSRLEYQFPTGYLGWEKMCEEIDRLREENAALFQEGVNSNNELAIQAGDARKFQLLWQQALEFNQRLMKELSQHGWGDFHYGPQEQDRNIVALLEEGGFQFERTPPETTFEAIVVQCQKTVAHEPHGWIAGDPANPTTYEAYWCGGVEDEPVETIDINTEPNVFERDPEPGTERAEIHTTNEQTPVFMETRSGSGRDDGVGTTGQETV